MVYLYFFLVDGRIRSRTNNPETDPRVPITYGSYESGSGTLTERFKKRTKEYSFLAVLGFTLPK
jgi:hypothetical protein